MDDMELIAFKNFYHVMRRIGSLDEFKELLTVKIIDDPFVIKIIDSNDYDDFLMSLIVEEEKEKRIKLAKEKYKNKNSYLNIFLHNKQQREENLPNG